jgi:uncharacterized membrane protein
MDFADLKTSFLGDGSEHAQILFRWMHVLAGVIWIGLLYFFNWVNSAFAPTMDGETKQKVVPELMPRALLWFRWGAAWTLITGLALLFILYYVGPYGGPEGLEASVWGQALGLLFVGFLVYDQLSKVLAGKLWVNLLAWGAVVTAICYYLETLGTSARFTYIHAGALFGTSMAANVWMRIWPAQQRIITAIKNGEAPDGADAAIAGLRSKHNTYMSIPLLLWMVSVHQPSYIGGNPVLIIPVTIVLGFLLSDWLYKKASGVAGF